MFETSLNTLNVHEWTANVGGASAGFNSQLTPSEKRRRHAIFRLLVTALRGDCFVANGEYNELKYQLPDLRHTKNFGALDADEIWKLGICPAPTLAMNALACGKLAKIYKDLSVCDCFYQTENVWRLDIDEKYSKRGLLLPLRGYTTGLIYGMLVYRYPDDPRPFRLKLRRQNG